MKRLNFGDEMRRAAMIMRLNNKPGWAGLYERIADTPMSHSEKESWITEVHTVMRMLRNGQLIWDHSDTRRRPLEARP